MFDGETIRYAAYDGQLTELDSKESPSLIPWISASWSATFKWRGAGELPSDEKQKLAEIVAKAHQHGRRVRFWGAPDQPVFWREMQAQGVDLINTDDLPGLQQFLTDRP
jgi:glycerophosphoryl diester phosphodiesterase